MKKQKIISGLIAMSMTVSGCSSPSNNSNADHPFSTQDEISKLGESQDKWVQLTSADHPNYALAELLSPWLWSLNPSALTSLKQKTSLFTGDPTSTESLQRQLQQMKLSVIFGEKSYIQDEKLLNLAVFSQVTQLESQGAFSLQIRLQTAAEAQAQAYSKVQNAFNEKLKANSREIGREIVAALPPEAIAQINALKNKDQRAAIQEIYQILQKWDKILAGYEFSSEDGHKLILYGFIATELYDFLKDHQTVKDIVQAVQKVQAFNEKVKEVRLLLASMDQYRDSLSNGWKQMNEAMEGIQNDIESNPDWAVDLANPVTDETKKKAVQAITDMMLGQTEIGDGSEKKSILSKEHPMSNNVKNFFEGAAKTAGSVDGLISGTRKVANTLGVQLDPKIEDALNTAQKISDGVKIAQQVASAFSSDGLMGAFSALAGSGGSSLIMGPAGIGMAAMSQVQMNAEFGKINKKLDEVINLQKEVLALQKQTLAKIEELSHKLDEYHNQEMLAIAGVSKEILESRRGVLYLIDEDLNSCYALVNRIASIAGHKKITSLNLINGAYVRDDLAKALATEEARTALQKEDDTKASLLTCSLALTKSFSGKKISDTPLSARLGGDPEKASPLEIQTKLFSPALAKLIELYPKKGMTNMALHLPVATFAGLEHKEIYWNRSVGSPDKSLQSELNEMISVDAFERYAGVLLSLHPLLSISSGAWNSITDVVENSWNGKNSWTQKQNRSEFWLSSALDIVNIAISQQALMAGEPLLAHLNANIDAILKEPEDCPRASSPFCYVRQNNVMAKNLLYYHLFLRSGDANFAAAYAQAIRNNSVKDLEKILGVYFVGRIKSESKANQQIRAALEKVPVFPIGGQITIVPSFSLQWKAASGVNIDFPSPEELQKGIISYPDEMARLVKLQERIADELTKVSPNSLSANEQKMLTELILYKGH